MNQFVLDASVALRWLLDHSPPHYAIQVQRLMRGGARALVPSLWHLEIASGLVVAERRGILTRSGVDRSLADIEALLAVCIDSYTGLFSARQTREIAQAFRLSAYDAVYLDLARRERLPLASLDEELRSAAPKAGVTLVH